MEKFNWFMGYFRKSTWIYFKEYIFICPMIIWWHWIAFNFKDEYLQSCKESHISVASGRWYVCYVAFSQAYNYLGRNLKLLWIWVSNATSTKLTLYPRDKEVTTTGWWRKNNKNVLFSSELYRFNADLHWPGLTYSITHRLS